MPPTSTGWKLLDRMRDALRARPDSPRTGEAYTACVMRFVRFHGLRPPETMGEPEVNAFLTDLAVTEGVAASTQTQALSALLFLHRNVLGRELGDLVRARRPRRLPVVSSRAEVKRVLDALPDERRLVVALLCGAGLRLLECLELRVKDPGFARHELTVRGGKGAKDGVTVLHLHPRVEPRPRWRAQPHRPPLTHGPNSLSPHPLTPPRPPTSPSPSPHPQSPNSRSPHPPP